MTIRTCTSKNTCQSCWIWNNLVGCGRSPVGNPSGLESFLGRTSRVRTKRPARRSRIECSAMKEQEKQIRSISNNKSTIHSQLFKHSTSGSWIIEDLMSCFRRRNPRGSLSLSRHNPNMPPHLENPTTTIITTADMHRQPRKAQG